MKTLHPFKFWFECISGKEIEHTWLQKKFRTVYRLYRGWNPGQSLALFSIILKKMKKSEKNWKILIFELQELSFIYIYPFLSFMIILVTRRVEFYILTSRVIRLQGKSEFSSMQHICSFKVKSLNFGDSSSG